jgi:hypothetical protein
MPELVVIGLVGAVLTFLSVNFNLYWVHRSFKAPQFLTLNHNLLKVGRYWSLEQGRLMDLEEGKSQDVYQARDYKKSTRSAFIFGTMMIFLSWLGLLFFTIYFVSINKFAKSRLEERIFGSKLVQDPNLTSSEVSSLLTELESFG